MQSVQETSIPGLDSIIEFRHLLHQYPELSGKEEQTARRVVEFMEQYQPDHIFCGLGGTGVAVIFEGVNKEGPTLLFRAELDALPIAETNSLPYVSVIEGLGHKCGHEGHMAILVGLASLLHRRRTARGRAILLFQPAEETGAGAWDVLQDANFKQLEPDWVFALHNMPGLPMHKVLVRNGVFSPASTGMAIELFGKESHAGEPENGLNPGEAMSEIIITLNGLYQDRSRFKALTLVTVVHARLGDVSFGINPGTALVMATLRSVDHDDFLLLKQLATAAVQRISAKYKLRHQIRFEEAFPVTVNNNKAVEVVYTAAEKLGLSVEHALEPVKWSEDFGHFTKAYAGALFGLGAGLDQPSLHHNDYDFPDVLIPTGARLFYQVAQELST